jgi:alpha-L-fucosidase
VGQAKRRLEAAENLRVDSSPATQALIGSNHHHIPNPGEDFQMFEKDLPGHSTQSFNKDSVVGTLPLETAETISNSWGYNKSDDHYKSDKQLIQYLVRAAGTNSNFLLNVGPMPNGRIQPEFVERLRAMGGWLRKNGASIYGTRGGPVTPRSWGVTTQKGDTLYVHILDCQDPALLLPKLDRRVTRAQMLGTGERVGVVEANYGTVLKLPAFARDPIDNIVVLETR